MRTKTIILIAIIIAIIGAIYYLEKSKAAPGETVSSLQEKAAASPQKIVSASSKDGQYPLAPELVGISGYLNTDGKEIKISDYKQKVVLVDFWTYTCINCIRTLPHLNEWQEKYADKGLVIIGVHTPEFEFEKKTENVQNAIEKYNIEYAVVQDNDYATWQAYKNRYWPHKYLIDAEGYIRYDHIGEGGYDETEKVIQLLLSEISQKVDTSLSTVTDATPQLPTTPELYAGYNFALPRGQNIGNEEGLQPDKIIDYVLPSNIKDNIIYLNGKWKSNSDNVESMEAGASIILDFQAKAVNVVADNLQEAMEVEVFVDDKYISKEQAGSDVKFDGNRAFILVDKPQLYNVVDGDYGRYTLQLKIQKEGFIFNAFTFG